MLSAKSSSGWSVRKNVIDEAQRFTSDDAVDLVNTFCIRTADGGVLDPACGSGSFLVRAYYRKRGLNHGSRISIC
jgi:type I restriction-modification system DNA methylase subunit